MAKSTRKRNVKSEEELFYGQEPEFTGEPSEHYTTELIKALGWYRNVSSGTDKKRWLIQWCKQNLDIDQELISNIPEDFVGTLGAVARLHERGFVFSEADEINFKDRILRLANKFMDLNKKTPEKQTINNEELKNQKLSPFYTVFDLYIDGTNSAIEMPAETLNKQECTELSIHYNNELVDVIDNPSDYKDAEALAKRIKDVTLEIGKLLTVNKITRVRRKKIVTKDKQVAKLNYQKDYAPFNLVSINPEKIIGANVLFVFNTKYRTFGIYHSEDGLTVKGSTLQNFNPEKSVSKTIRKPEEFLPQCGAKIKTQKLFDDIRSKEKVLTGRINKDTIILKAW